MKGIGFLIALMVQIVFGTLKLTGVVGWSWLWVTSPAWIYCGLVALLLGSIAVLSLGILAGVATAILAN